jgi:hypothetical protein
MYTTVLLLHSWLRWVVLIAAVGAMIAAYRDTSTGPGGSADRWGLALVSAVDLQLLLGLLLYFVLSPTLQAIRADFGAAMRDPAARFWAVEHISMMLAAVVLIHVGRILARKATTAEARRTRLLFCFGLALVAMIAQTPWPGMASGRPLFRV